MSVDCQRLTPPVIMAATGMSTQEQQGGPVTLSPLSARTLADQTAEALRALIVAGRLRGGERLVEAQIAEQLQVSRGPVRDAFRQLRAEGLLRDVPRRGTYVVALTADDVLDLLNLRAGLEARAARLVIDLGDQDAFAALEAAWRKLANTSRTGNAAATGAADYRFHETLCRMSGSRRLHAVFVRYATELRTLLRSDQERLYEIGVDVAGEHEALLRALQAGDAAGAEDAFRTHVEATRDRLVQRLRKVGPRAGSPSDG